MLIVLSVSNELSQQRPPKAARANSRKPFMTGIAEFCQHPGDPEGCRRSLIQAWSEGSVEKHCIIEGLRVNWHRCRQVLLEGLYDKTSAQKGSAGKVTRAGAQINDLENACKEVVVLGCPQRISAIEEVFCESYQQLVRTVIRRFGLKREGQPSADDVFQDVFTGLFEYFRRGASVEGPLAKYIAAATRHKCFRAKKSIRGHHRLPDEYDVEGKRSCSTNFLSSATVECWEQMDNHLLKSSRGNLVNRIILAQRFLEKCTSGKELSAKELKPSWQELLEMTEHDVADIHEVTLNRIKGSSTKELIFTAAELINLGSAQLHQLAIIFATCSSMNLTGVRRFLEKLSNLSENNIYVRIHRTKSALVQVTKEEENSDET